MAIAIEGYCVVGLRSRINEKYLGGMAAPSARVPNSTELMDDELWRCSFMAMSDAEHFLSQVGEAGMQT
jgi:hypothetical protein